MQACIFHGAHLHFSPWLQKNSSETTEGWKGFSWPGVVQGFSSVHRGRQGCRGDSISGGGSWRQELVSMAPSHNSTDFRIMPPMGDQVLITRIYEVQSSTSTHGNTMYCRRLLSLSIQSHGGQGAHSCPVSDGDHRLRQLP